MSVHNLIKKIKETGSTERRKRSGRPVTATTEEIAGVVEDLISSQEDEPGTHIGTLFEKLHLSYQLEDHQSIVL